MNKKKRKVVPEKYVVNHGQRTSCERGEKRHSAGKRVRILSISVGHRKKCSLLQGGTIEPLLQEEKLSVV